MTISPYSRGLRAKVINYLACGENQSKASKLFGRHKKGDIRIRLIAGGVGLKKEGSFLARVRAGAKRKLDIEALVKFVEQ